MVHPISTANRDELFQYFQRLWRVLLRPGIDFRSKVEYLLADETRAFDLDIGYLSRVDREEAVQQIEVAHGPVGELLEGDQQVPLEESFCRRTIADPNGSLAVSDAVAEGWLGDPAYERFGLGTYLGTTVSSEGELYGTLCFADQEVRSQPISDDEAALLDLYGTWVSYELDRWPGRKRLQSLASELEDVDGSPHATIDLMFEALSDRTRRQLALSLVEHEPVSLDEFVERTHRGDRARIKLRHVHVPKLEDAGFVDWDVDAGVVIRGPNFEQIEPVVRLVNEYTMEFPTDG